MQARDRTSRRAAIPGAIRAVAIALALLPAVAAEAQVRLDATLAGERFVAGQDIELTVSVHNDGDAPVTLPDPMHAHSDQPS